MMLFNKLKKFANADSASGDWPTETDAAKTRLFTSQLHLLLYRQL